MSKKNITKASTTLNFEEDDTLLRIEVDDSFIKLTDHRGDNESGSEGWIPRRNWQDTITEVERMLELVPAK